MEGASPDAVQAITYLLKPITSQILSDPGIEPVQRSIRQWPRELSNMAISEANKRAGSVRYGVSVLDYLSAEISEMAEKQNQVRNHLMGTHDKIDSYDVCRGVALDPELNELLKPPAFPYNIDPVPMSLSQMTLGAQAAFSAYLQACPPELRDQVRDHVEKITDSTTTFIDLLNILSQLSH
jgi:hypothetical protein